MAAIVCASDLLREWLAHEWTRFQLDAERLGVLPVLGDGSSGELGESPPKSPQWVSILAIPQNSLADLTAGVLMANCTYLCQEGADHENAQRIVLDEAHGVHL